MKLVLKELQEAVRHFKKIELHYLVRTNRRSDENEYLSFQVPISSEIAKDIKDLVLGNLLEKLVEPTLEKFNPTSTEVNTVEFLPARNVNNYSNIYNAINSVTGESIDDLNFEKIWGYCLKITYGIESKEVILFKKFSYPKLLSKSIIMSLIDGVYSKIDEEIITVDNTIHAFSLGDLIYVINKGQFEKFFNFSTAYQQIVNDSVETLEKLDVIENFTEFTQDCLNSDTLTRRLVKIIDDERFENLQKNITNVPTVINDFALSVKFDKGKIVYDEESTITDIITLIKGACVYGALDRGKYLANDTKSLTPR